MRLVFLFFVLYVFSGCVQVSSIEDRLACTELSSYNFTHVPECFTQEACFHELQSAFDFNPEVFVPAVQKELFEAKNHLARSWLFLNRARNNLQLIHGYCQTSRNLELLPKEVNELNNNILTVGKEIDSFNKSAIRAINFELDSLELEDINLVRHSPLFDDYILLNQNIVDFAKKNTHSDTFASRFLFQSEKFRSVAATLELQNVIQETTLFSIVSEHSKLISKELVKKNAEKRDFPVGFVSPIFTGVSKFLTEFFALGGAVSSLKKAPSASIFLSINSLIASENSSASAFFSLFSSDSIHRLLLMENNAEQKKQVLASAEKARLALAELSNSLDAAVTTGISGGLLVDSASFGFAAGEKPSAEFRKRLAALESDLRVMEEAKALGNLSLGSEASALNNINSRLDTLLGELALAEQLFKKAGDNCSAEVEGIKKQLSQQEFLSSNPRNTSLREHLSNQIASFESDPSPSKCVAVKSLFSQLAYSLNAGQGSESTEAIVLQCISDLESFPVKTHEHSLQLSSLKRIPHPYSNPLLVLDSCISLKNRVEQAFAKHDATKRVSQLFRLLEEKTRLAENFSSAFPRIPSAKKISSLSASLTKLSENFSGGLLKPDSFSDSPAIESALGSALANSEELLKNLAKEAVESSAIIEKYSLGPNPFLSRDDSNIISITFSNPVQELPVEFSAIMDTDSKHATKIFSTPNVFFAPRGGKTELHFEKLLFGHNSIILDLNANMPPASPSAQNDLTEKKAVLATRQKIIDEKNRLIASASAIFGEPAARLEFQAMKVELLAEQGKLAEASAALENLRSGIASENEKNLNESNKVLAVSLAKRLSAAESLQGSLLKKLGALESNFSKVSEGELEEVYAYSPITMGRVAQLKALASERLPIASSKAVSMLEEEKFSELAEMVGESDIIALVSRLEAADAEAGLALQKLKQNSLSSYNNAVSARNAIGGNSEEVDALLVKSRESLEKGAFLSSLVSSEKAARGTTGLVTSGGIHVPLAVYPLVIVILAALFFAYKRARKEAEPPVPIKIKPSAARRFLTPKIEPGENAERNQSQRY